MANQFNDSIPAVTNQITEDVADIAESLGFLKDCFQKILGATWSNTDASGLKVEILAPSLTFGSVTKTCAISSPSLAASVKVTGLTAGGIYKVSYILTNYDTPIYTSGQLSLRFNDDSGANYNWCNVTSILGTSTTSFDSETSDVLINISCMDTITQGSNDYFHGSFTFAALPGDLTRVLVDFRSSAYSSSAAPKTYVSASGMGFYDGAANITEFDIYPTGSALTGTVITERIG